MTININSAREFLAFHDCRLWGYRGGWYRVHHIAGETSGRFRMGWCQDSAQLRRLMMYLVLKLSHYTSRIRPT